MPSPSHIGLRQWIWRAFARSALIPLLLVETVLIAVYLISNGSIRDAQIDHLRKVALFDLQSSARQESRSIDQQLAQVGALTEMFRNLTARTLLETQAKPLVPPALASTPDGVRYSPEDKGGSAVFYARSTPLERQDLDKVARMATLDPLMKELQQRNPLVASLYFNGWDNYNHIYPWFLTHEQYPHDMVIPNYSFYYLADARHNPGRGMVWTDVYLDPAGHGWMMSAIAPVYRGDFLEGVVGLDVTVSNLLEQIGRLEVPWSGYAVLVSDDLDIMALPEPGEADFGLDELTSHSYDEAIHSELFKPEDFNLRRRPATAGLAAAIVERNEGMMTVEFRGRPSLVAWTTIPQTGWHLLTVVDEARVFAETNSLASQYERIGYLMIAGLLVFYLVFFGCMWLRARHLSERLLRPIDGISRMMEEIGGGNWRPARVSSRIVELDAMAGHAERMGEQLEQSERQSQRTQERLELVLDSATESLWEQDLHSRRISLRGRFCKRFGLPAGPIDHEAFMAHVHPEDVPRVEASFRLADSRSGLCEADFRFRDSHGSYHWLLGRGRVVERDPATGQAVLLAGTHVDIDTLKRTEADLRLAIGEAQAASQAKSRFISSISHELRTPLNAIYGFAQLLRLGYEARGETQEVAYLDELLRASRHLNQLVDDVLDWSNLQTAKFSLEMQSVEVAGLMAECAEMVRLDVETRGLRLDLEPPDKGLLVRADPRRLRQVLLNLLSNAIKYNSPAGRIALTHQAESGRIRLIVEDTGPGIDESRQVQLFEPFQRLGRENSTIQGTGIGLSLCRQFAVLMGGRMGMSSEPGTGSRFWIDLPLVQDETGAGSVARICHVGDDSFSRCQVRKALVDLGEVSAIDNGRAVLERVLASPPDLLLLDLDLPDIGGERVLERLRQHPQTRSLPVIVLGAAADAGRLVGLDCQGRLGKPLDPDELRELVAALLPQAKPEHAP
ncbi:hybrid sensory histidine protein kinase [Azotobacter vinelandii CA]|uniref:histidine kinase n=2 Tax=Azotobacter vinelandii TaxID=354 RepID=C1DI91_AZOVD|nr:ATP-binding protein [Azotobacter vinelandii]ACO76588.1 hybrid sensory histidine protein kinase [Azotobacter vinelandii DJ]AGK15638.1 hybrid sensory histidine protein kinase [Azotobacter vinelandii CA]AGK19217.1 hybrid sensory histidine protein kinase [Azotobacter vinelandii CA6]WKN22349.1 ATP-binding protein [Azotobacter vinelandii]SFX11536.1 Cache sensor hybrid histidine kinase [Azotobacter vinelandii]